MLSSLFEKYRNGLMIFDQQKKNNCSSLIGQFELPFLQAPKGPPVSRMCKSKCSNVNLYIFITELHIKSHFLMILFLVLYTKYAIKR